MDGAIAEIKICRMYLRASNLAQRLECGAFRRFLRLHRPLVSWQKITPVVASIAFLGSAAPVTISQNGASTCVLVQAPGATPPEKAAVAELAAALKQITGAAFEVVSNVNAKTTAIIAGPGPAAVRFFPDVKLQDFGPEELVIKTKGNKLLLAGGQSRGTLYAVDKFLESQCGVRWWAPWATDVPHRPELKVSNLDIHEKPAFEFRDPFCFSAFDVQWKVHNCVNSSYNEIPKELGGCIKYKGHAHTFYPLVPPANHFKEHPEWYSLIKGKRTHDGGQLCLTNPQLRDFVVTRAREWLREAPDAQIISITQNDWFGWCECEQCKALDDAEGSHAGSMISFVNYIAEKIEPEFPNVWVDTFAYQYTRKPPKTVRPRKNVIVRLCSIECNFREPLDAPSNAGFFKDLDDWSKICSHLYVWDYTTDFSNYVHPHPNWFTLGPNARVFASHSVKGIFEEGAYAGYGSEMGELRSWVLAKLLWNPQQDDRKLIQEFVEGYYGPAAARPITDYLQLMQDNSKGVYLKCFLGKPTVPYLSFPALGPAERLWQQAEKLAAVAPEKLLRVQQGHLPVRFAFLKYWERLRHECSDQKAQWPLSTSRKQVADEFRRVCAGAPGKNWTHVHVLNEHGETVEAFLKPFATDPPEPPPARP
jgi:Domain of unknown function (DUF4838)